MKIISTKSIGAPSIIKILRSRSSVKDIKKPVFEILKNVKNRGDKAILNYTKIFDGITLKSLRVSKKEIEEAYKKVSKETINALKDAKKNIYGFHKTTFRNKEKPVCTQKGVKVWREFRPIERVGIYAPGGKASYPSTVLMLSVPAKIAGCEEIILCSPPSKNGKINPVLLAAADLCGVNKIFKIGGAQAIAAMAYGTKTVPKVSKIFGPGNRYVTTAKLLVYGDVDIDMPAGPSELMIIADDSAKVEWVAADLLSQLEHGQDSQAVLLSDSKPRAISIINEMKRQMKQLSRNRIIAESFKNSYAIITFSIGEACEICNGYAPEHLEIIHKEQSAIAKNIKNAGSIFIGKYTCESLGDYATGGNHTLPTAGYAKMFGPLSTEAFGKMVQFHKVSKSGVRKLSGTVATLASIEGLDAHKKSLTIRL